MNLKLEKAKRGQISEICDLVNLAYRGDVGWTRETDIVAGNRTTVDEIESSMTSEDSHFLVAMMDHKIVSCVCIQKDRNQAHIGLFAVHPDMQGTGIGSHILAQVENFSANVLNVSQYVMVVVSQRSELIAYYERRGYKRTGDVKAYPDHLNVGVPIAEKLTIDYLVKNG